MATEKWGFMLIFWNLAGVPLSYCHCTLYLVNHEPREYQWPRWALVLFFSGYLFVYWVWDTCNSQKNIFRQRERGDTVDRKTFPQLPWKEVKNPRVIKTDTGDSLLCDGWCTSVDQDSPSAYMYQMATLERCITPAMCTLR
jgi:delta24(24(1))-sterol reductase